MDYDEHVLKEVESGLDGNVSDKAQEVTFLIFAIIATAANVLLLYTICYFRSLHTNANIYLINWAIADIGTILTSLCYFDIFTNVFNVPEKVLYFYYDAEGTFGIGTLLFMFLFTIDWCLSAYFSRFLDKFRKHTEIIVAVIWILIAIYLITTAVNSLLSEHMYIFILIIYAAFFTFVVVLHCTRLVHKCKGKFEYYPVSLLLIPTAFAVCWILCWINLFLLMALDTYIPIISWFSDTPVYVHPIINLILMVMLDKDFKTCFFRVIESASCGLLKPPANGQENTDA